VSAAPGPDRRFLDLWSLFYDLPLVQRLTCRPVHDQVLSFLHATSPHRVLDVGCRTTTTNGPIERSE